ncbi:hypothetical protein K7T73_12720 [Bacillus badius]|uniref:hypothetical protein n=1 Tax=Bacillus badius TaxID=1455 RepID=UPI001CBB4350|nr:hypothetical protein [Bacillus badius]UAT29463.1 hypothetical protein K7T73_12720 [Bacillus badius]
MKNKYLLLVLSLLFSMALAACNDEKSTKEAEEPAEKEATTEAETEKTATELDINEEDMYSDETGTYTPIKKAKESESVTSGPFTISIPEATAVSAKLSGETAASYGSEDLKYIQVQLDVAHNTEDTDMIMNELVKIVTNTGEQLKNDSIMSEVVDDKFYGKVKQSGFYFFVLKDSQPEDIEWIRVLVEPPLNEKFEKVGEPFDIRVDFQ